MSQPNYFSSMGAVLIRRDEPAFANPQSAIRNPQ